MTKVNRDRSKAEQENVARNRSSLRDILKSLDSGETLVEDYPEDEIERLRALLDGK